MTSNERWQNDVHGGEKRSRHSGPSGISEILPSFERTESLREGGEREVKARPAFGGTAFG